MRDSMSEIMPYKVNKDASILIKIVIRRRIDENTTFW